MDESELEPRDRPVLSEAALAKGRAAFKAWIKRIDFFESGFPEDREIDAFLSGLLGGSLSVGTPQNPHGS